MCRLRDECERLIIGEVRNQPKENRACHIVSFFAIGQGRGALLRGGRAHALRGQNRQRLSAIAICGVTRGGERG